MHAPRSHGLAALLIAAGAALLPAPRPARAQSGSSSGAAAADTTSRLARIRILGVYDDETGEPIEGADVSDLAGGYTVRTTVTGTVPLYITGGSSTLLRIKKLGYQQTMLVVPTGPLDTVPVTTTLLRMGHVLPTVVVSGNRVFKLSKADTVRELLRNGFYLRRATSAAPRSAFVTGDRLNGVMLLSDARFFGRAICESNLYVDGQPFRVPARSGHFLEEGIDQFISPYDVAGIETYYFGESPAGVTGTMPGTAMLDGGTSGAVDAGNGTLTSGGTLAGNGCVSLIWLRH